MSESSAELQLQFHVQQDSTCVCDADLDLSLISASCQENIEVTVVLYSMPAYLRTASVKDKSSRAMNIHCGNVQGYVRLA